MKKFTRNFLFVEHGFGNVLRKIGLSMVAILMAVAVYAQAQDTYHVWADDVEECYRYDNDYEVPIRMRDFVVIDSFKLVLDFDATKFSYKDVSAIRSELTSGGSLSVSEGTNEVIMEWKATGSPVSVEPNNDTLVFFVLHFSVDGHIHPENGTGHTFSSDLEWDIAKSSVWNDPAYTNPILTSEFVEDGSILVKQEWADIVVDVSAANCFGGNAVATVITPDEDSLEYSFNSDNDFNPEPYTTLAAPSEGHTVVVRKGGEEGCVSYVDTFSVGSQPAFSYTVQDTVYTNCPGGQGDVEFYPSGGKSPYAYYIVPSADTTQVLNDISGTGKTNAEAIAYLDGDGYNTGNRVNQLEEGYYLGIAVDDYQCINVRDRANWTLIWVTSDVDDWYISNVNILDEQCYDFDNGGLSFEINGATPSVNGYSVLVNGSSYGMMTDSVVLDEIAPGDYLFTFTDSLSCRYDTTISVGEAFEIVFDVDYNDAACGDTTGAIWITGDSIINSDGVTHSIEDASTAGYTFVVSTVTDFDPSGLIGTYALADTAKDLLADAYYVRIYEPDGCFNDFENENEDNAVKLLSTDITVRMDIIECYGDSADWAKVTVTNPISGDAGVYKYAVNYANASGDAIGDLYYVPVDSMLTGPTGMDGGFEGDTTYVFTVMDTVANCAITFEYTVDEPEDLKVKEIDALTVEPTCHGAFDGDIQVLGSGGTTFNTFSYKYKFDDLAWDDLGISPVFASDTGMHTIYIQDASGCIDSVEVPLYLTPNVIDVFPVQCDFKADNLLAESQDAPSKEYWFTGVDTLWLDCASDTARLFADTISWIHEPVGSNQGDREPQIYWHTTTDAITSNGNLLTDSTNLFPAGTYFFQAIDEWGCTSNIDTFVVWEPEPLEAGAEVFADAGCEGTRSGVIKIWGLNQDSSQLDVLPECACELLKNGQVIDTRYQYAFVGGPNASGAIMQRDDWYDQVTWIDFHNDDAANDSVVYKRNLLPGSYWVGVRNVCAQVRDTATADYCPEYSDKWYWKSEELVVSGIDALELTITDDMITDITCDVMGAESPSMDGAITGLYDALEGGSGGFEFTIDLVSENERYDTDDLPDFPMTNMSGDFYDLPAGAYTLTVEDSTGCMFMDEFEIGSSYFYVEADVINASCYDVHDGIIRFNIEGGTAPFKELSNNLGPNETIEQVALDTSRWYTVDDEYDRLVQAGTYTNYWIDANGCIFGPLTVEVEQPEELGLTVIDKIEPSCSDTTESGYDGQIWVTPTGGWESVDTFMYHITVGTVTKTAEFGDTVKFTGLTAGDYMFKISERNDTLVANPVSSYEDYYASWDTIPMPYQNADTSCYVMVPITLNGPEPLDYDVEFVDTKCWHGDEDSVSTGQIILTNITGGTKPYSVWLEGPVWYANNSEPVTLAATADKYTWDDLVRGHYTIYIEDAEGCQLVRESGEIERPDTLMITNTELIENALCNGGEGIVQIHAEGGVMPYNYALAEVVGEKLVPEVDDLVWQDDSVFNVKAGVWIAFVEDANGCMVGYATIDGEEISQHRVTVLEPDPIVTDVDESDEALCYGANNGAINLASISGGNGAAWTVQVTGTDYAGNPVNKTYENVSGTNAVLDSLYASTSKTKDYTADDYYWIHVFDSEGCEGPVDSAIVHQPEEFVVTLEDKNDAFVCPSDLAGVFEIKVVKGGTPFASGNFKYKWQGYTDETLTEEVDTLGAPWSFVNTFQGYAGFAYVVWAQDVNGCTTWSDTFIVAPEPVEFEIDKISCYDDTMASARVMVTGTEGRSFRVWYREIEEDVAISNWMTDSVWFTGSHDMIQTFEFDDDDLTDFRYAFYIEDTIGCESEVDTLAFDPVQNPLVLDVEMGDEGECTSEVVLSATGGMPPYEFHIMSDTDTIVVAEGAQLLAAGTYDIKVVDSNFRCYDMEAGVVVETMPVVRDTMVETFIGYETQFVDTEAGLDTMLAAGTYTFTYMYESCVRTLNVEVVPVPREADIVTVQSEADESAWVGDTVQVSGTVTAVVEGEGFFLQDAVAAWSGIWVAYTTTADLAIGDGATVVGEVAEVADVTTINASTVTEMTAPLAITAMSVEPMDAEDEMYESVLVIVEGARANALDTTSGEWVVYTEVDNDVVVNDWMYAYEPTEGNFYDVTGVVNGLGDAYLVEPRMESDVVDLSDPAVSVNPELDAVDFKVYPNPFNDHIKIDNNDKLTRVVISNIAGQRVMDLEYPSHEIRTARLVSGVYVVSMFTEDGLAKTERIIKW